eukprot:44966-Eustigmatos_ZCMA.PRE.1
MVMAAFRELQASDPNLAIYDEDEDFHFHLPLDVDLWATGPTSSDSYLMPVFYDTDPRDMVYNAYVERVYIKATDAYKHMKKRKARVWKDDFWGVYMRLYQAKDHCC